MADTAQPLNNRLGHEISPYLLQHRDNPVAWQAWGPEAFAAARASNRPVLLSVGYAACHWCHVMAHESFEDAEIAALMNRLFVNIKVDREERPDIDTIYQQALSLLGEQGGWPLTMFLTPDAEPFWGGTYFPPEPRYGRPGFPQVLNAIAEVYANDGERVGKNVAAIKDALERSAAPMPPAEISTEITDKIAEHLIREVDPVAGGIGQAPKFPQCAAMKLLWRAWKRRGQTPFRDAVLHTLTQMSQGGIYDHLGGGFARYTVDSRWLVPHFEKMLYDNAQLLELLGWAWQETREPLFAQRARETVSWLLREMIADSDGSGTKPCGAFASTLDADSEGEEGKFYVWHEAEIDSVLGAEAALFKEIYDVTPGGNWEGKTILNRTANPALREPAVEARLAAALEKLLAARAARVRPGWDDKVLADWNGLMIAALARAAMIFEEPAWLDAARRAFGFVRDTMVRDGRLLHAWRHGRLAHPGLLDDYANMSAAALALCEATGDDSYIAHAQTWVATLDAHYWDEAAGGYFLTADDTERMLVRTKSAHDNAMPSGNGIMAEVLARLYHLTGDDTYRTRAEAVIAAFSGELSRNFFPLATLVNANEFLRNAVQVVIAGDIHSPRTAALRAAAYRHSVPDMMLRLVAPGADLPPTHPAHGKGQIDGQPAAYVCHGTTCSLPITDPDELSKALSAK
jgi:uncharacterized protein YyaL (SSP411 family)